MEELLQIAIPLNPRRLCAFQTRGQRVVPDRSLFVVPLCSFVVSTLGHRSQRI